MSKLVLLSIVFVSFAVPMWLARSTQPRRALRRVQWIIFAFIVVWAYMCLKWYPQLVPVQ